MSLEQTAPKFSGISRRLVSEGILTSPQMQSAILNAKKNHQQLIPFLVEHLNIKSSVIAELVAQEFGEPFFDLDAYDSNLIPKDLVATNLITKHSILPLFQRGITLFVATSDPTNIEALEAFRFNSKLTVIPITVEFDKLERLIHKNFSDNGDFNFDGEDLDVDIISTDVNQSTEDDNSPPGDDSPIVKYINKLLVDAIRMGASDLHFEPYEKSYRVRYRIDGILRLIANPPLKLANRLASRLKVMSQMDISEKRVPQDGRIKLKLSKSKAIDFRVNALPTLFGEKLVLRILDPTSAMLGIDALGYEEDQKALFMEALEKPQGMLLITGPTGSGKTVSLYTGINILNTENSNISTAEDPVEINLDGVNQVNVNTKVGLTFSVALKSFLRQDPDIIMVGEIRDLETAEIAIKAAQTGHMVMSTLHTNSAPETLTRLRNMGVPSFNIATSINLVIAQRLARRLCNHCKTPIEVPKKSLLELGFTEADLSDPELQIFQPVGCSECRDGYKGRLGIYEVMKITPEIAKIIMEDGNAIEIAAASRKQGVNNLRRSGLIKVMKGFTSLQEINRVTSE